MDVHGDIIVTAYFFDPDGNVSVKSIDRVIPPVKPAGEISAIVPVTALTAVFTAGPNPAGKSSATITFFRQGSRIKSASLFIYDAAGNVVNKINIDDNTSLTAGKRLVGTWDLADRKGHRVPEGSYLVKGTVKTVDRKTEKVSLLLGVRR
jgi:flagellar hook assembly protein FlgD